MPNLGINMLCPYQESNLDLPLRRQPFYPLNYKDFESLRLKLCDLVGDTGFEPAASRSRTVRATNCANPRWFALDKG